MVSFRRAHKDLDGRKVVARHPTTAVATNSSFTEWDNTFGDARLCAAIADRITFRCALIPDRHRVLPLPRRPGILVGYHELTLPQYGGPDLRVRPSGADEDLRNGSDRSSANAPGLVSNQDSPARRVGWETCVSPAASR
ncbi:ATP-binding protein [Kitasatospora sp. NPDC001547]|uniref:ATP-binding protein n=1 Tax=Kitasatospora sp. NPDC001547 TaxID=3364015 RepID=UPI0036BCA8EE